MSLFAFSQAESVPKASNNNFMGSTEKIADKTAALTKDELTGLDFGNMLLAVTASRRLIKA